MTRHTATGEHMTMPLIHAWCSLPSRPDVAGKVRLGPASGTRGAGCGTAVQLRTFRWLLALVGSLEPEFTGSSRGPWSLSKLLFV